jgi:hypothetical protein
MKSTMKSAVIAALAAGAGIVLQSELSTGSGQFIVMVLSPR